MTVRPTLDLALRRFVYLPALVVSAIGLAPAAQSQTMKAPDITKTPTLYVVPYAHLDTQWRWEFPQTISEFLLKTLRVNFDLIDHYPHYVFNWTGANRYRLMKEYFPSDYARMKGYVAAGRWFPAGSSVEEGDVNLPSAEGIFRQVLYGNVYFDDEFGKHSNEYMLPDCFGFPASLPTILTHAGVKGFSTQKLSAAWQPAPLVGGPDSPEKTPEGIPFNVGRWIGPDGTAVVAALNPGDYGSQVFDDLSKTPPASAAEMPGRPRRRTPQDWVSRIDLDGKVTGVYADYHYVGTGDIGGATTESSVKLLEATVTHGTAVLPGSTQPVAMGDGPVHVVESTADQMFNDLTPAMAAGMPQVKGDLELINHSAGSLTSEAWHKQQVLKNEVLADAAEKSSMAATWLGARAYPQARLNLAWMLALGGHFHDTAAGTATPKAYEYAWNDDAIVANQFKAVLDDATQAVVASMDTRGAGQAIVVFNPLNIEREDLVEARLPAPATQNVRVTDADGHEVASQVQNGTILFVAHVPSVGFAVYHFAPGRESTRTARGELSVTANTLENAHYRVSLNAAGDVASIFDKTLNKELLAAPMRLAISTDTPKQWPAWNMDFDQEQAAPRAYVSGPAQIRIAENGPARVAIEVKRTTEGSTFVQTVSLAAGEAGERVVFGNSIDWRGKASNLKAVFALTATNKNATYSWDVGTVSRPTAEPRQFEVGSHRWIDLTDATGTFGATVLTGYKNGSDKPTDNTVRLTLLRTPGIQPETAGHHASYTDQANQDWGHHEFSFGLAGHKQDWRAAGTDWQANALATPLLAFTSEPHPGALGKTFSLLKVDDSRVRVLALKKAERSGEVIVRLVELDGRPTPPVHLALAGGISSAREVNAQEQPVGEAQVQGGVLVTSFSAFQPRTFAITLAPPATHGTYPTSQPVALSYDAAAASNDDTPVPAGGFDGAGNAYPAEMLPASLNLGAASFKLGPAGTGTPDALVAHGQKIPLPAGSFRRVYLLASSTGGDQKAVFKVDGKPLELDVQPWNGKIGQWDTRQWKQSPGRDWAISANHAPWPPADFHDREQYTSPRFPDDYVGLEPGFTKPAELAWFASHHHTAQGLNQPYEYSYLFVYSIETPEGAKALTLPDDPAIRIFAISTGDQEPAVSPLFNF